MSEENNSNSTIPYARFKEVLDQSKEYEMKIKELTRQIEKTQRSAEKEVEKYNTRIKELEGSLSDIQLSGTMKETLLSDGIDPDSLNDVMDFVKYKYKNTEVQEDGSKVPFQDFYSTFKEQNQRMLSTFAKEQSKDPEQKQVVTPDPSVPQFRKSQDAVSDSTMNNAKPSKSTVSSMSAAEISKLSASDFKAMKADILKGISGK